MYCTGNTAVTKHGVLQSVQDVKPNTKQKIGWKINSQQEDQNHHNHHCAIIKQREPLLQKAGTERQNTKTIYNSIYLSLENKTQEREIRPFKSVVRHAHIKQMQWSYHSLRQNFSNLNTVSWGQGCAIIQKSFINFHQKGIVIKCHTSIWLTV